MLTIGLPFNMLTIGLPFNMLTNLIFAVVFWNYGQALSPVVIIPGTGGNQLEATLVNKPTTVAFYCHQNAEKFTLWLNPSLLVPFAIKCWADNIRLEWNMETMVTSNSPGVFTEVPAFGQTASMETLDATGFIKYMRPIADELVKKLGYNRNHDLHGAPYDFRHSPDRLPHGFIENLGKVIEDTYNANGNQSVSLISHSYGSAITLFFFSKKSQEWKDKYIKQWISLSGVFGGTIQQVLLYASGYLEGVPDVIINRKTIRGEQRTSTSNLFMLPSASLWKNDDVVVTTSKRKYKISEIDDFLQDVGFPEGIKMRNHILNSSSLMENAPGVRLHCYYGNIPESTVNHLQFTDNFPDSVHSVEKGLGDGTVNHESLSLCRRFADMQKAPVTVKEVNGENHSGILENDSVIQDIISIL